MHGSIRWLAWMQRFVAAAIALFWITFWFENGNLPPAVVDFEMNFIIPDLVWIAAVLVLASRWLLRAQSRGLVASAAAGGALVFLGLLDVMFNLRHGQYTASSFQGPLNAVVNLGCIGFGLWSVFVVTRHSRL